MSNSTEVIISDFSLYVNEKDKLTMHTSKDKWELVPYETSKASGNLIIASKQTYPSPITITPNLIGYYKIYVCLGDITPGENHIDIKLTDDEFERTISSGRLMPYSQWIYTENVEESFWKIADMTNQNIIISKPDKGIPYTANIFWFRFEKLNEDEITYFKQNVSNRNVIAHMDGDFHLNDITKTPHDYCKPIYSMIDSDVGIICEEVTNDICDFSHKYNDFVNRNSLDDIREKDYSDLTNNRHEIYKAQLDYAHKFGIKLFATERMQLSNFAFDLEKPMFYIPFVESHPELRCKARDGSYIDFLSYAYKETQDFMLDVILDNAKHGFDGMLHIWTRGISLYLEDPVIERFKEKYGPDIDCRLLPETDSRICEIKCDIMTEFYIRVKEVLQKYAQDYNTAPPKIYITCCYDVESSKIYGIDIERLAEKGLIDGVIQTKLKLYENINDVLDENNYINLEKYKEKAKTSLIFEKTSGSRMDLIAEGIADFRKIIDKYGIEFYSEIQWESLKRPEEYVKGAKTVYKSGGLGISLWDCYPCRVTILSEWNAVSRLGNKENVLNMSEETSAYHTIYKVMSYNNKDVRYINPSWRG